MSSASTWSIFPTPSEPRAPCCAAISMLRSAAGREASRRHPGGSRRQQGTAQGAAGGRTACFLSSFGSRGREDEALTDRPSSGSECCCAILFSLDLDEPPVTVLLLPTLAVCTLSEMMSSTGLGFRACATASGQAWSGRKGAAMLARTRLERTVTGRTFSLIFSRRWGSAEPNTIRWTRL